MNNSAVISNATVIEVDAAAIHAARDIVIGDGRITAITAHERRDFQPVMDAGGAFVCPGLIRRPRASTQPFTRLNTRNMATIGNAAALDPADGTKLWTTEQWSDDAARCVWKTRIVEYQIAPARQEERKAALIVTIR